MNIMLISPDMKVSRIITTASLVIVLFIVNELGAYNKQLEKSPVVDGDLTINYSPLHIEAMYFPWVRIMPHLENHHYGIPGDCVIYC